MTSQTTAQCFMGPINCHAGTFTTGHVREEITFSFFVNCTHRNKIHSKCFIKIDFISLTKIHIFFPRPVLAYGYCRCLRLSVCVSVRQSLACPRDNSGPVQARITKFGPKIQNSLIKVPIVLWSDRPWPSRSNLRYFELVRTISHHPFKLLAFKVKFDLKCQIFRFRHYWKYTTTTFFLVCFFISIIFQFLQLPALTTDIVNYHVLCCHDIRIFMVLSYGMKCWLVFRVYM